MRQFLVLAILLTGPAIANPPECPIYNTKKECLQIVDSNYNNFLDFINNNTDEDDPERDSLLQASQDIKKYEGLACEKTCWK